jgi:hypothetical protein
MFNVRYENMRKEFDRLASFTENFPYFVPKDTHKHITPEELAAEGFFYRGIGDLCTCYVCGITLSNWEPDDTPSGEHMRHSPHCPFVLDRDHCGNVPLEASSLDDILSFVEEDLEKGDRTKGIEYEKNIDEKDSVKPVISDGYVKGIFVSDLLFSLLQTEMSEQEGSLSDKTPDLPLSVTTVSSISE